MVFLPLCHAKNWLIGKDSDAGRDWGQEEKGTTEDEMAGWHHWLDGHEFEWTPGVGDGQGGLACCNSWGRKELDTTEQLNWTELIEIASNYEELWEGEVYMYLQTSTGAPMGWVVSLQKIRWSCNFSKNVTIFRNSIITDGIIKMKSYRSRVDP